MCAWKSINMDVSMGKTCIKYRRVGCHRLGVGGFQAFFLVGLICPTADVAGLKPPVRFAIVVFFCSGGLEKGKTLVHPTTTPWIVAGFDKIGKSRVPNHQIGPGLCCLAFPHHDFWGLPRHFFGGSETSDTSLAGRPSVPPADRRLRRVVVLPLGTSAQNALGPLSWGARAGDRWVRKMSWVGISPMVGMEKGGVLNFQGSLMLESSQWLMRQIPNFACQGSYYRLSSWGWKASTQFRFPP